MDTDVHPYKIRDGQELTASKQVKCAYFDPSPLGRFSSAEHLIIPGIVESTPRDQNLRAAHQGARPHDSPNPATTWSEGRPQVVTCSIARKGVARRISRSIARQASP